MLKHQCGAHMKLCSIGTSLVISCAFAHNALAQMDLNTAANVAANVARGAITTLTEGPKATGRVIKGENPVKVIKDVANDRIEILIKPNEVVAGADQKVENHVRSVLPKKLGQISKFRACQKNSRNKRLSCSAGRPKMFSRQEKWETLSVCPWR